MAIITYSRNSNYKRALHFRNYEFDCKCGCPKTTHDTVLSQKLECLRKDVGQPIKINSGYRCATHNRAVGGSANSKHTTGQAADIKTDLNPVALGILAHKYFDAVGIYWYGNTAFVHVDTRPNKVTWLCTTSGKYKYTSGESCVMPTVRKGSKGEAVKMLQRLLGLSADGVFGNKTNQALRLAQRKHGIKVDGICGQTSWKHISGAVHS